MTTNEPRTPEEWLARIKEWESAQNEHEQLTTMLNIVYPHSIQIAVPTITYNGFMFRPNSPSAEH